MHRESTVLYDTADGLCHISEEPQSQPQLASLIATSKERTGTLTIMGQYFRVNLLLIPVALA